MPKRSPDEIRRLTDAYELAVVNSLERRRLQVAAERELLSAGAATRDVLAAFMRAHKRHMHRISGGVDATS